MFTERKIPVLDNGFITLVGTTIDFEDGTSAESLDAQIARAARQSYTNNTTQRNSDTGLLNYLMRNRHTSPFEMVEFKFQIKAPLFVVQQWLRHRTANLNQESARYSELADDFYIPESIRSQSLVNKQSSSPFLGNDEELIEIIRRNSDTAYNTYKILLSNGVAREQARMVLPSNIYTHLVWKCDLHTLLHFLKLRLDSHAQYEIRVYAEAMLELIREYVPITVEAWEQHIRYGTSLSMDELDILMMSVDSEIFLDVVKDMSPSAKSDLLNKVGMVNSNG